MLTRAPWATATCLTNVMESGKTFRCMERIGMLGNFSMYMHIYIYTHCIYIYTGRMKVMLVEHHKR